MAKVKRELNPITDQQLNSIEGLLNGLQSDANAAVQARDLYMGRIYGELIKVVTPIVDRAHARKNREERAVINRGIKQLSQASRTNMASGKPKSGQPEASEKEA